MSRHTFRELLWIVRVNALIYIFIHFFFSPLSFSTSLASLSFAVTLITWTVPSSHPV